FSADVAGETYANVRQYLNRNQFPPRDAVRIEDLINHFTYSYPRPSNNAAIGATIEAASAPWNPQHRLVRIGIKAAANVIANDVQLQVEFNPAIVGSYRLIGYENRSLRNGNTKDARKDAGTLKADQSVTGLYEIVLKSLQAAAPKNTSNETLTLKINYKDPVASNSKHLAFPFIDRAQTFERAGADCRSAAAVASFGMILRDSPYKGSATLDSTLVIAKDSKGADRNGYRREFIQLVERARRVK